VGLLSSCPAANFTRVGDLSSLSPPTRCIRMNSYPADELRISEVERGLSSHAVLPLAPGTEPAAGDSILFAQALSTLGQEPRFVMGGDSVRVLVTDVTDLGETDPSTGLALFRVSWEPLGHWAPIPSRPKGRKVRVS
jgi:hypothetical protein